MALITFKELREIARLHYSTIPPNFEKHIREFLASLDTNGDGKLSLHELLNSSFSDGIDKDYIKQIFYGLDEKRTGNLGIDACMAIYFLCTYSKRICRSCNHPIAQGLAYTCFKCHADGVVPKFQVCLSCFSSGAYQHPHASSDMLHDYALFEQLLHHKAWRSLHSDDSPTPVWIMEREQTMKQCVICGDFHELNATGFMLGYHMTQMHGSSDNFVCEWCFSYFCSNCGTRFRDSTRRAEPGKWLYKFLCPPCSKARANANGYTAIIKKFHGELSKSDVMKECKTCAIKIENQTLFWVLNGGNITSSAPSSRGNPIQPNPLTKEVSEFQSGQRTSASTSVNLSTPASSSSDEDNLKKKLSDMSSAFVGGAAEIAASIGGMFKDMSVNPSPPALGFGTAPWDSPAGHSGRGGRVSAGPRGPPRLGPPRLPPSILGAQPAPLMPRRTLGPAVDSTHLPPMPMIQFQPQPRDAGESSSGRSHSRSSSDDVENVDTSTPASQSGFDRRRLGPRRGPGPGRGRGGQNANNIADDPNAPGLGGNNDNREDPRDDATGLGYYDNSYDDGNDRDRNNDNNYDNYATTVNFEVNNNDTYNYGGDNYEHYGNDGHYGDGGEHNQPYGNDGQYDGHYGDGGEPNQPYGNDGHYGDGGEHYQTYGNVGHYGDGGEHYQPYGNDGHYGDGGEHYQTYGYVGHYGDGGEHYQPYGNDGHYGDGGEHYQPYGNEGHYGDGGDNYEHYVNEGHCGDVGDNFGCY